jgi:polyphosphate kinase
MATQMTSTAQPEFLDRDISILEFNRRVLSQVRRNDIPLLERLRYLCIVSSNLDEFFEVRALLRLQNQRKSKEVFDPLTAVAHALVDEQYALFNDMLMPAFGKLGIYVLSFGERSEAQHHWVKKFFDAEVRPLLLPVVLDPAHPFPQVANKSLNFIAHLDGKDAFGRHNEIAIVKVPRSLPRLIPIPPGRNQKAQCFVSISSIIRAHLQDLFPERKVGHFSQFRITRNSDLAVDEEEVKNLRTALRAGLAQRNFGQPVRLEVSAGCAKQLADFLLRQFELTEDSLYRVHGPVNLVRMRQLIELVDRPDLLFKPFLPGWPPALSPHQPVFEQLAERDVLIHQPYESFETVLRFLREAVNDPQVLAIKQTIYRTGAHSEMMELLESAVQMGKEVTVVVELKARFDEEANINWAERLERIGAQVVYGVVGLKTHAKMLLVSRKEKRQIKRYAHLSTGNYNPVTARLYTDLSQMTANTAVTRDVDYVFSLLANQSKLPRLASLLIAPFTLHKRMIELIRETMELRDPEVPGRIILKMNALTDEPLMEALWQAADAGVDIDLIVRGACMLPPRASEGGSGTIRVRSIVGRFLEHSRVFYFRKGDQETVYLSSADWMNRNMLRRIELAWPVTDPELRRRIVDECLVACLADTSEAWELQAYGTYLQASKPKKKRAPGKPVGANVNQSAQLALMQLHTPLV